MSKKLVPKTIINLNTKKNPDDKVKKPTKTMSIKELRYIYSTGPAQSPALAI